VSVRSAIALGSNVGDRKAHLDSAVEWIRAMDGVREIAVSPWIESAPVGGPPDQGAYLNGALVLTSDHSARALLDALQSIERAHGRDRSREVRNGPRTIDLDLLVHGDDVVDEPGLTVPHPRMAQREFVLEPLCAIAPDLVVPGVNQSVRALLAELRAGARAARSHRA
jgi:2-amino-4-hydroxy-6-hydroxymethyldihydropteridine diphosphokinase